MKLLKNSEDVWADDGEPFDTENDDDDEIFRVK